MEDKKSNNYNFEVSVRNDFLAYNIKWTYLLVNMLLNSF
jgi:hypothetical protein